MDFKIPCRTYARLLPLPLSISSTDPRDYLRGIYVERVGGKLYAVATNARFAAIEYLGVSAGEDGWTILTLDPMLSEQVIAEAAFGNDLFVTYTEMLNYTSARTTFNFSYPVSAAVRVTGKNEFLTWREWLPPSDVKATNGAMFVNVDDLTLLVKTSPSGAIIFPKYIDADVAVILRDTSDENWLGVFMPNINGAKAPKPAKLPDWI